jgi:hypothetical protein
MTGKIALLHPVTVGAAQIGGITDVTVSSGENIIRPTADGSIEPFLAMLQDADPRINFTTMNIKAGLDVTGFSVSASGAIEAYDAVVGVDGVKAANGAVKYSASAAVVFPRSLSCSQSEVAQLTLEAIVTGGDLTVAVSQALSAYSAGGSNVFFGLGPVSVNGTALSGISAVSITFGVQEFLLRADGAIHAQAVAAIGKVAEISITGFPDTAWATFGNSVQLNNTAGLVMYLRKRTRTGYVADGTAEHIRLQVKNGIITRSQTAGQPRQATFTLRPDRTTADAGILINTASAIT